MRIYRMPCGEIARERGRPVLRQMATGDAVFNAFMCVMLFLPRERLKICVEYRYYVYINTP